METSAGGIDPTTGSKVKILLVDDHPIVRLGLAQLITQEPDLEICAGAASESEAWDLLTATGPDLVIVDLSLQSGDGIGLIKRIRSEYPQIAILVLSMHEESYYVERALRAGAWGYLTKREVSDQVMVAIRKLLGGEVYLSDRLSPSLLRRLLTGTRNAEESMVGSLSDREFQVFGMIGSGRGAQEIAEELHLSIKTIETYQAHIKEKLHLKDSRKLVQYAIRWVLNHESSQ